MVEQRILPLVTLIPPYIGPSALQHCCLTYSLTPIYLARGFSSVSVGSPP